MRTLILKMSFSGEVDEQGMVQATFVDEDGPKVSTDEALKGIAFGAALLFKNKLSHMPKDKFVQLMTVYTGASIDACMVVPDRNNFN